MASAAIDVYVKLPSGKAISLQHWPVDSVRDIAQKVADGENIPANRLRLKYQGKVLDKSKTIAYLGICAETILKVEVVVPKDITIKLKLPDNATMETVVMTTDTVSLLKDTIHDICGIKPHQQTLQLNTSGTINGDSKLLCDVGIVDQSVVTVKKTVPRELGSFVEGEEEEAVDEEVDEEVKQGLLNTFDAEGRRVEVVFCFDTTGSMYSCLAKVRTKLRESCQRLLRDIPNMRIGIMANGDYCDYRTYVVRYVDLTDNVDTLVDFAQNVPSTGGGDAPEAYEWALRKAQQLDWSEDSAKAFVMIGDDLPHAPSYTNQNVFWQTELNVLMGMSVKVYGVRALHNITSEPFYKELAERSGGFYLQLKDFNLITDMFLAVCYREADDGQLDAFVEEVEKEGRMTENTKLFLDKLEEKKEDTAQEHSTENNQRYVAEPWWDPSLCGADVEPSYDYNVETDTWTEHRRTQANVPAESFSHHVITTSSTTRSSPQRKKSVIQRILNVFGKSR